MTAIEYIQNKGIKYKLQSGQIVIDCPMCGDSKGHFYMAQEDGAFFCHKCNEKGNLITLKKFFGDNGNINSEFYKPVKTKIEIQQFNKKTNYTSVPEKRVFETHDNLLRDTEVLEYVLEKRKIDIEVVKKYKLGVSVDKDGVKWLTIPHYQNSNVINVKSRTLPPADKTFRRIKDCKSILFNVDCLLKYKDQLFITEGEIDALTLLSYGINNVVAVTNGAGSFDSEWIDQLRDINKIILCYDQDEAGQKGAKETARRLGYDKCFNLVLPDGMDINDYFNNFPDAIEDFQKRVANAGRFDVVGIKSFNECINLMEKNHGSLIVSSTGLYTGIKSVDRLNKRGLKSGELWIVAAPPGVGKSSLALQIIINQSLLEIPALLFSLEMNIPALTEKIVQFSVEKEIIEKSDIIKTRDMFLDKPLYLGRVVSKPSIEGIMEILKEATKRYGIKIIAFDHLHFLCRSLSNQVQEIGLAVQAFKLLAEEMEIPIILIAQPRKVDLSKPMTAEDLKDSSSIHSDADGIIILHRKRMASNGDFNITEQSLDPITMLRFEKSRYGKGGECLLDFHGEYSKFKELED